MEGSGVREGKGADHLGGGGVEEWERCEGCERWVSRWGGEKSDVRSRRVELGGSRTWRGRESVVRGRGRKERGGGDREKK